MVRAAHCVGLGCGDFVTVRLFFARGTGVAAVGGVTVGPTVESIVVVLQSWFWDFMAAIKVAICAWVASGVPWTRAIASACSVGGTAAGAKGLSGIAVTFPVWYPAWLEVVSTEEQSCTVSVKKLLKFRHILVHVGNFAPFAARFDE